MKPHSKDKLQCDNTPYTPKIKLTKLQKKKNEIMIVHVENKKKSSNIYYKGEYILQILVISKRETLYITHIFEIAMRLCMLKCLWDPDDMAKARHQWTPSMSLGSRTRGSYT